jgi:ABC-type transport system involved in multi-copper enzyme maturation permease subunit
MKLSVPRVRAIFRKDLREFRRNRSIVVTMAVIPLFFSIAPLVQVFAAAASSASTFRHGNALLYLLGIPALVPALLAAYAVVGERVQGTLEPVLTTPIRREEFLLGKALAALVPSLLVSYAVFAAFIAAVELFARPGVAPALVRGPQLLAQLVFTPLLAIWSIWLAMAISTRTSEVRVAQQLGMLASIPTVAVTTLIAYDVIHATVGLALILGAVVVGLDRLGWRIVSALFDRERLITGTRT